MAIVLSSILLIIAVAGTPVYFLISKGKVPVLNRSLKILYILAILTTFVTAVLTAVSDERIQLYLFTAYYMCYAVLIFMFMRFAYVYCTGRSKDVFLSPSLYGTFLISFLLLYNIYSHNMFTIRINMFNGFPFAYAFHQDVFFLYYILLVLEGVITIMYMINSLVKSAPIYRFRYIILIFILMVHCSVEYISFMFGFPIALKTLILIPECIAFIYISIFYSQKSLTASVLRFAVYNQADGLMIYDENNNLIYTNNKINDILTADQLYEFRNISNIIDWNKDLTEINGLFVKKIEKDQKTYFFNVIRHKFEEKGAYIGMSFTFQDMTDAIERIEIMEKANEELMQAAHMKSDFLANMSHEIRTPMNAVIGLAEMSLREEMTDQARDYISQIKSSGRGLLNIINDILDFSKIESGKMDIIPETYEPFSEFNDVANTLVNRIGEKDLELTIEENPNIPCRLEGDVLRIRQILINLANNAIKFTQKGRVQIICDYDPTSTQEVMLKFHVVDTGIGIKPDDLKKLFVSFQQVDSKRNRSIEGTGLGLAISKSLVEAMGGTIGVESEYGKGSDFYFSIPQKIIDPMPSVSVENPESVFALGMFSRKYIARRFFIDSSRMGVYSAVLRYPSDFDETVKCYQDMIEGKRVFLFFEESDYKDDIKVILDKNPDLTGIMITEFTSATKPDRSNLRIVRKPLSTAAIAMAFNSQEIRFDSEEGQAFLGDFTAPGAEVLIVDDNPVNLTVAEGLLEPLHMNITCATGGREALELLEAKHFDIVFMDHMMPELDGVETTRIIRRLHPELDGMPIIALTANAIGGAKEFFLREGMQDFVPKPIEIRDIMIKVKKWLPDEMIQRGTRVEEAVQYTEVSDTVDIPGLDCETAISMVGTPALYRKILKEYYRNIETNHEQLSIAYANEDWENFTIKVHALKSSSRQIGAMELSEKAAALENAGKTGDYDYLKEYSPSALADYKALRELLKAYCEDSESDTPKQDMDTGIINDIMNRAIEASDDLDMDAMETIVDELEAYNIPEELTEDIDAFKESAELMDVFTCREIAEKILDMYK